MWFKKKKTEIRTVNYDNKITLTYPNDIELPKWGEILVMEANGVENIGKVLSVRRIVREKSVEINIFVKQVES